MNEINVNFIEERCPECKSRLLSDGTYKWCSFVGTGTREYPACSYGIKEKIYLNDTQN